MASNEASRVSRIHEQSQRIDGSIFREIVEEVVTSGWREGTFTPYRTEKIHLRQIGDRVYTVLEVEENNDAAERTVLTSMKKEQVPAFMEEWDAKWRPLDLLDDSNQSLKKIYI